GVRLGGAAAAARPEQAPGVVPLKCVGTSAKLRTDPAVGNAPYGPCGRLRRRRPTRFPKGSPEGPQRAAERASASHVSHEIPLNPAPGAGLIGYYSRCPPGCARRHREPAPPTLSAFPIMTTPASPPAADNGAAPVKAKGLEG